MDQQQLDHLIAAHEAWIRDPAQGRRMELRGGSLRGLRLAGRLIRAHLEDVDASGCDATNVELDRTTLRHVQFSDARLAGAHLSDARCDSVTFSRALLEGALLDIEYGRDLRFDHATLCGVSLVKAGFERARFDYADLTGANDRRAHFLDSSFAGATLRGVNFELALLSNADLRGADLTDARLLRTRLSRIKVHSLRGTPAVVANCTIEAADASAAGDGSEMHDRVWLLRHWGVHDPLHAAGAGRVGLQRASVYPGPACTGVALCGLALPAPEAPPLTVGAPALRSKSLHKIYTHPLPFARPCCYAGGRQEMAARAACRPVGRLHASAGSYASSAFPLPSGTGAGARWAGPPAAR
jgi:uncharacterized protein YjbI with pentapeptide repeats